MVSGGVGSGHNQPPAALSPFLTVAMWVRWFPPPFASKQNGVLELIEKQRCPACRN